jgi:hypothetical protein
METAISFSKLVYKYLAWRRKHRSPRTVEWYEGHLRGFLDHLAARRSMPAAELKPYHLVEWVDGRDSWGDTSKRGGIMAVQRVLNWAVQMGYTAPRRSRGAASRRPDAGTTRCCLRTSRLGQSAPRGRSVPLAHRLSAPGGAAR